MSRAVLGLKIGQWDHGIYCGTEIGAPTNTFW